jgi:hypothetical protein
MTASEKRKILRKQFWPNDDAWTGEEDGWFKAPRTLPLLLVLLKAKALRGKGVKESPATTYLELLSHHYGGGLIELRSENEHAHAAGFTGTRAVRSWKERMATLEKIGFIKTRSLGAHRLKYVLLMHPVSVVQSLKAAGDLDDEWWDTYRARQMEVKEPIYEDRPESEKNTDIVSNFKTIKIVTKGKKPKKVTN